MSEELVELKELFSRIEDLEMRFSTLLNLLPIPIFYTAASGANLFVNKAFEEFVGFTKEELRGDGWKCMLPPSDHVSVTEYWADTVKTQSSWCRERTYMTQSGKLVYAISSGIPVYRDSELIGFVGYLKDIRYE